MSPGAPAIEFRNVTFLLEDRLPVFEDLDLTVEAGERCVLLGASGTGTSFFGRMALGLFRPRSGSVRVLGVEIATAPLADLMELRQRSGFVFRDGRLIGNLDVEHNIALPLNYHRALPPNRVHARVASLMDFMALTPLRGLRPAALSSEQRMRVALARSAALAPEVLYYDNLLVGFSEDAAIGLLDDVGRLLTWVSENREDGRRPTLVLVATERRGVDGFADRIGIFMNGQVVMEAVDARPR